MRRQVTFKTTDDLLNRATEICSLNVKTLTTLLTELIEDFSTGKIPLNSIVQEIPGRRTRAVNFWIDNDIYSKFLEEIERMGTKHRPATVLNFLINDAYTDKKYFPMRRLAAKSLCESDKTIWHVVFGVVLNVCGEKPHYHYSREKWEIFRKDDETKYLEEYKDNRWVDGVDAVHKEGLME